MCNMDRVCANYGKECERCKHNWDFEDYFEPKEQEENDDE